MGGVEEREQDAAQGGFSSGGVVPLGLGVDASSGASGGQGDGGNAKREREVGVGGADAGLGADAQVAIDGEERQKQRGAFRQYAGRAIADDFKGEFNGGGLSGAGLRESLLEDAVDLGGVEGELLRRGGAEVELHGGGGGDGVDGGSSGDATRVERGAGVLADARLQSGKLCQGGDGAADEEDGVGRAGIGPGVASGAGDGDAEAPAAEGAGDDGGGSGAFEGQQRSNAAAIGALREEMAHAAEIAFAFLADVGDEEQGVRRLDFGKAKGGEDAEQGGQTGSVVAASGAQDAGSVFLRDGVGSGGEDGIQMGGEHDDRGVGSAAWQLAERIAFLIDVDVTEAELGETGGEPGGAGGLPERGGGDGQQLELPEAHLGLMQVQPMKGAVDGKVGGEARDAMLGEGGMGGEAADHAGYSTESSRSPRAGAVRPAARRSRAARMAGMASGASLPAPASTKVPTRLRTMWWRKPEPVTR